MCALKKLKEYFMIFCCIQDPLHVMWKRRIQYNTAYNAVAILLARDTRKPCCDIFTNIKKSFYNVQSEHKYSAPYL